MSNDAPSWDNLRRQLSGTRFSPAGIEALGHVIDQAAQLLGSTWPRRQYERMGWWPNEFNLLPHHAAALPQFLTLVLRLETAAKEPTFDAVLANLRRGVTSGDWRHALLQLEVGRAMRDSETVVTYEPEIDGSVSRADVMVRCPGSTFLVETKSLARANDDLAWEEYEQRLWQAVTSLALQHDVHIAIHLVDHLDEAETATWLDDIDRAARSDLGPTGIRLVDSSMGHAEIRHPMRQPQEPAFLGAALARDGWRRLRRAVQAKAHQSTGPLPVWLRIDALDGFFQFTDWAKLEWPERVDRVASALQDDLAGAEHLAGIVLSSGLAIAPGATNSSAENRTARTPHGHGLRRLVSPHTVRETIIVALRDDANAEQESWASAYAIEPSWLPDDLAAHGLPKLAGFAATSPPDERSHAHDLDA